jgi:hypothetical protein
LQAVCSPENLVDDGLHVTLSRLAHERSLFVEGVARVSQREIHRREPALQVQQQRREVALGPGDALSTPTTLPRLDLKPSVQAGSCLTGLEIQSSVFFSSAG